MKIGYYTLIIFFFGCMYLHAQDFHDHEWKHRVLIVKGKSTERTVFLEQLDSAIRTELKERKIVMYLVGKTTKLESI